MDTIQAACAQLAGHRDRYVQKLSEVIEQADRQRDIEYGKIQARLSKATSEIKTLRSELKRTRRQVEDLKAEVAEQTARTVELLREQYSPKSETAKAKRRQGAMRADGLCCIIEGSCVDEWLSRQDIALLGEQETLRASRCSG
ncbi:hypothetical protein [Rhodovulum sulfidophilum]|uniref:hypothetical protein n=1 Tax=Rhodovulum sulfidophilum TaxID=35806 RepID=UPI00117B3762|nr:hypothetical protein [Rhodovulum sulfidophilum]